LTIKAQVRLDLGTTAISAGGAGKRRFPSHKAMALGLLAAAVAAAGLATGTRTYAQARSQQRAAIARELIGLGRTDYLPQKAIYHVDYDAGWFEHNYSFLLSALHNHERAVGADKLHLVVVLQGNGLDLLALAKTRPALAKRIDKLKAEGVRFLVCKNSLVGRAMDPFTDLYGVAAGDIVTAAVAELVSLQQEGYIYLHL
jgi:uncharacterized protein